MGFPAGYATELIVPNLLIPLLSLFTLLQRLANTIARSLRPHNQPSSAADLTTHHPPDFDFPSHSLSAALAREALTVALFSSLPGLEKPESCAVCLHEFEAEDEVRLPANCSHVFHRSCLDRWIGYDQRTCPLCRTALISDDLQESINERLWGDAGIRINDDVTAVPEVYQYYSDELMFYPPISTDL